MTVTIGQPPRIIAEGFKFTECPRWHDGQLYFSDMHDNTVYRIGPDGKAEPVVRLNCHAGGFGFAPDGSMLVVAQKEGRILRVRGGEAEVYADLSSHARGGLNDMIVSPEGRCYAGRFFLMEGPYDEPLFFVDEQGTVHETAENLAVANGIVLTEDGKRLIVAESAGCRIAVFDVGQDGMPRNGRTFAQLAEGYFPDGICGDDHGGTSGPQNATAQRSIPLPLRTRQIAIASPSPDKSFTATIEFLPCGQGLAKRSIRRATASVGSNPELPVDRLLLRRTTLKRRL